MKFYNYKICLNLIDSEFVNLKCIIRIRNELEYMKSKHYEIRIIYEKVINNEQSEKY